MKLGGYLLFFTLLAGLNSCMWGVPDKVKAKITTDTLIYTYKTIKEKASDCNSASDSGCTVFSLHYPVFKNAPALTAFLKISDTAIASAKKSFFADYEENKKDISGKALSFEYNDSLKVVRQDSSLVTIQDNSFGYYGGAHGMNAASFVNWNSKANKALKLSELFKPGYEQQLTKIAEIIFRKDEKLSETASLADDYFFKDGKFTLNENFLITPLGIKFLYNDYEIKPGAAGQTELLIPYAQIKQLLKPNTVITQYIK
jgi:hypothetical protein